MAEIFESAEILNIACNKYCFLCDKTWSLENAEIPESYPFWKFQPFLGEMAEILEKRWNFHK